MRHAHSITVACAVALAMPAAFAAPLPPKQLSGPPSEFTSMRAPSAVETAIHSKSALIPVELSKAADGTLSWSGVVPFERADQRVLVLAGGETLELGLTGPGAAQAKSARQIARQVLRTELSHGGAAGQPADYYALDGVTPGQWTVALRSTQKSATSNAFLLVEGDPSTQLLAHTTHLKTRVGESLGFVASVYDYTGEHGEEAPGATLAKASLRLSYPDGRSEVLAMRDDGQSNDGLAGDGVYGVSIKLGQSGLHNAQVIAEGTNGRGLPFIRTSEHLVPVVERSVSVAGTQALARRQADGRLSIALPVAKAANAPARLRAYGEVWGRSADGRNAVPVAWVGGIVESQKGIELGFDPRWIALAKAQGPFELRNLRVEELDHYVSIIEADTLSLTIDEAQYKSLPAPAAIDDAMRMGPRPAALDAKGTGKRLLLVHGYCSGNVWGGVAGQFSNASVFADYNQNRTHDQFAQRIRDFGATWNSFGVVAHSQGGAASLHLYTYYWSGLDNATGSRLIQSVGTPYQGTSLAGNLAAIGSIFGVGCGTNSNLTYSGATSWLAGIPTSARGKVNYYTTTFNDRWWAWDYCHIASDVLLGDPEDGTTENSKGQLSGAVNRGLKPGWCHTSGMRDPAQTTDSSRNSTMSANAAR